MKKETQKKNSCGFLKFLAFCACVTSVIMLARKIFEKLNEKDEQKNYNSEIRRFCTCFNAINENLGSNEVQCIKLSAYFSAVKLDLRRADISSNLTIDIAGAMSAVKILLPANCTIVNVSDCKTSAIEYSDERVSNAPTVTLVGRINMCAVSFEKG